MDVRKDINLYRLEELRSSGENNEADPLPFQGEVPHNLHRVVIKFLGLKHIISNFHEGLKLVTVQAYKLEMW